MDSERAQRYAGRAHDRARVRGHALAAIVSVSIAHACAGVPVSHTACMMRRMQTRAYVDVATGVGVDIGAGVGVNVGAGVGVGEGVGLHAQTACSIRASHSIRRKSISRWLNRMGYLGVPVLGVGMLGFAMLGTTVLHPQMRPLST